MSAPSDTVTPNHLFVYGTLCPDCEGSLGQVERARLLAQSTVVGQATARGRLVDLGEYPGLVEGAATVGDEVQGILLALADPARTFAWLDDYEIADGTPSSEYERVIRKVWMPNGQERDAWVYLLRAAPRQAVAVPSGRWRGRDR